MDNAMMPEDDQFDAAEYVEARLMQGNTVERVAGELADRGWSPGAAQTLVSQVTEDVRRYYNSPEYRQWQSSHARNEFLGGIGVLLIGAFMAIASILLPNIGTAFSIFSVVFGLFMVVGGVIGARHGWDMTRSFRRGKLPFEQPENTER
jgi:hypothetical protein